MLVSVAYEGGVVVLIGMMGAGKTTVGKALASLLDVNALDNDGLIAERGGAGAAEILRTDATKFRTLEAECIEEMVNANADAVFSVGGGAPATPRVGELLGKHSPVVWIRVPEDELQKRLMNESASRPMLDGDAKERLHSLLLERTPTYENVAGITVDGVGDPNEVARRIEMEL